MKHLAIFSLFLFGVSLTAYANYSVNNYNPAHTPYNLEQAVGASRCGDEVSDFDSDYDALANSYNDSLVEIILISGVQGSLNNINAWFEANELYYSTEFRNCIAQSIEEEQEAAEEQEKEEYVRTGLASCNLAVIEDLTEEEEERFADKLQPCVDAREAVIRAAVAICDFNFFDNEMTRNERNSWFMERTECEENPPVVPPEPVESAPVYIPEPVAVEPVVAPYVPPAPPAQVQETVEDVVVGELETEPVAEEEMSTSTVVTTTEEVIEVTQEELDRMVEEKLNEKLNEVESEPEPESEEKPSLFRRVTNFLFGWMF